MSTPGGGRPPGPLTRLDAWLDTPTLWGVTRREYLWGIIGGSIAVGFVLLLLLR